MGVPPARAQPRAWGSGARPRDPGGHSERTPKGLPGNNLRAPGLDTAAQERCLPTNYLSASPKPPQLHPTEGLWATPLTTPSGNRHRRADPNPHDPQPRTAGRGRAGLSASQGLRTPDRLRAPHDPQPRTAGRGRAGLSARSGWRSGHSYSSVQHETLPPSSRLLPHSRLRSSEGTPMSRGGTPMTEDGESGAAPTHEPAGATAQRRNSHCPPPTAHRPPPKPVSLPPRVVRNAGGALTLRERLGFAQPCPLIQN